VRPSGRELTTDTIIHIKHDETTNDNAHGRSVSNLSLLRTQLELFDAWDTHDLGADRSGLHCHFTTTPSHYQSYEAQTGVK